MAEESAEPRPKRSRADRESEEGTGEPKQGRSEATDAGKIREGDLVSYPRFTSLEAPYFNFHRATVLSIYREPTKEVPTRLLLLKDRRSGALKIVPQAYAIKQNLRLTHRSPYYGPPPGAKREREDVADEEY